MRKIINITLGTIILIGILIISNIGFVSAGFFDETNTEFSLANAQPSCINNKDPAYWQFWDGFELIKQEIGIPIPPKYSCHRPGGYPSDGCCPDNEWGIQCNACVDDAEDYGKCIDPAPVFCSDYNEDNFGSLECAEASCKAFSPSTAKRSIVERTGIEDICSGFYSVPIEDCPCEGTCEQFTSDCRCYWDPDDGDGLCKSTTTGYIFNETGVCSEGECLYRTTTKDDDCAETGLLTYTWGANWTDLIGGEATRPSWCEEGTRIIDCSTINLKVFTFLNIVFVVLILIIIYYFINKSKKNGKNRK